MDRLEKIIEIMKSGCSATCCEREGCIYYNGDCNLDYLIDVLFRFDKVIKKEQSITLKNVDTSNVDFWGQRYKFIEDRERFDDTIVDCVFSYEDDDIKNAEKCKKRSIEEFWDMVQTGLRLLQNIGINADEVMSGYPKFLEKFKK